MKNTELQRTINQLIKNSLERVELSQKIDKICMEIYGYTYSESDCDYIIDSLDYGAGGTMPVAVFDEGMRGNKP